MSVPYVPFGMMECGKLYVSWEDFLSLKEKYKQLGEELARLKEPPVVYSRESGNVIITKSGAYWKQWPEGTLSDCPTYKQAGEVIDKGIRYIKVEPPTFPPLPKPLPPKPELKKYRVVDHVSEMIVDEVFWGFKDKRGHIYPGNFSPDRVEEIKEG